MNGAPTNVNYRLQIGDIVTVQTEEDGGCGGMCDRALLEEHGISVLWEDESFLCLVKPQGLITHPTSHYQSGSLGEWVSAAICAPFRPLNRLDVGTGGLLVAAKNSHAAARLVASMEEGRVRKTYLAFSRQKPQMEEGVSVFFTKPHPTSPSRRVLCGEEGQKCETEYRYLGEKDGIHATLCRPLTGRTHQIRITMASLGAPLLGDTAYAYLVGGEAPREREDAPLAIGLFAVGLVLPHPISGEELAFSLPWEHIPYPLPPVQTAFW